MGTEDQSTKALFEILRTMTRTERLVAFDVLLKQRVEGQLASLEFGKRSDAEQVAMLDAVDKVYCTDCGEDLPRDPRDEHFCDDEEDDEEDDEDD